MANQQAASGGIGFCGLLTLVFVAAKLWDRIDWSWWWVCSPMWIPLGLVLGICTVALVVYGALACVDRIGRVRPRKTR